MEKGESDAQVWMIMGCVGKKEIDHKYYNTYGGRAQHPTSNNYDGNDGDDDDDRRIISCKYSTSKWW